jgi:hypothetical protein
MQFGSWIASGPFHFDYLTLQVLYCGDRECTASRVSLTFLAEEKVAEPALALPCGGAQPASATDTRGTRHPFTAFIGHGARLIYESDAGRA